MHTGARLYKIPLLENKATCTVMNLIKLAHRHLKTAFLLLTSSVLMQSTLTRIPTDKQTRVNTL